jgi:hypothetical protein
LKFKLTQKETVSDPSLAHTFFAKLIVPCSNIHTGQVPHEGRSNSMQHQKCAKQLLVQFELKIGKRKFLLWWPHLRKWKFYSKMGRTQLACKYINFYLCSKKDKHALSGKLQNSEYYSRIAPGKEQPAKYLLKNTC